MEDDIDLGLLIPMRDLTKDLIDACTDVNLLDLIAKLLMGA